MTVVKAKTLSGALVEVKPRTYSLARLLRKMTSEPHISITIVL